MLDVAAASVTSVVFLHYSMFLIGNIRYIAMSHLKHALNLK